jgi:F-type H+-transporting ATPase subunit c
MKLVSKILLVLVAILITGDAAFAAEGASAGGIDGLAAGLAIGVAAFGGALAQGKTTAAALEGIGRNPGASGSMFVPMIIGLALIESLVIYALVVAFKLLG